MTSAEDAIRKRMARDKAEADCENDMRERAWKQIEAECSTAIRRLERKDWPGGRLVTLRQSKQTPRFMRRSRTTTHSSEIAIWRLGTLGLRPAGDEGSDDLHLGSDGLLYVRGGSDHIRTAEVLEPYWTIQDIQSCLVTIRQLGH